MRPDDGLQQVRDLLVGALDATEQTQAAAYLDTTPLPDGRYQAFVDRRPGANWTHEARTLLIDPATGRVAATPADRPPEFGPLPPGWQLVWKAPTVEEWQLLLCSAAAPAPAPAPAPTPTPAPAPAPVQGTDSKED